MRVEKNFMLTAELEEEYIHWKEIGDRISTLLHPGTRSWRSLILSLIFSLLTCKRIEIKSTSEGSTTSTMLAYSLCEAVTVGGLPSLGPDMNVIFFHLPNSILVLCRALCSLSCYIFLLLCFSILHDDPQNCWGLGIRCKLASQWHTKPLLDS